MSERKIDSLDALFHEKAVFVHMGGTMGQGTGTRYHQRRRDSLQGRGYPGSVGAVHWPTTAILLNKITSGSRCWRQ